MPPHLAAGEKWALCFLWEAVNAAVCLSRILIPPPFSMAKYLIILTILKTLTLYFVDIFTFPFPLCSLWACPRNGWHRSPFWKFLMLTYWIQFQFSFILSCQSFYWGNFIEQKERMTVVLCERRYDFWPEMSLTEFVKHLFCPSKWVIGTNLESIKQSGIMGVSEGELGNTVD